MHRPIVVFTVLALVLGGVACAKKLDTGFPPASATASVSASSSSSVPTTPVTAATLTAQNIQWTTNQLLFKANEKITVTVDNKDATGQPHNLGIWTDPSRTSDEIYKPAKDVAAGDKLDYIIPALKAGKYYFECDIHKSMNGTITVR